MQVNYNFYSIFNRSFTDSKFFNVISALFYPCSFLAHLVLFYWNRVASHLFSTYYNFVLKNSVIWKIFSTDSFSCWLWTQTRRLPLDFCVFSANKFLCILLSCYYNIRLVSAETLVAASLIGLKLYFGCF